MVTLASLVLNRLKRQKPGVLSECGNRKEQREIDKEGVRETLLDNQ